MVHNLLHLVNGHLVGFHADELRIIHVLVGELHDPIGQRGGPEHTQSLRGWRHPAKQVPYVLDEPQIEHAIGLIQHQRLHCLQVEYPLLEVIDEPPGCADEDIYTLFELGTLRLIARAAVNQAQPETCVSPQQHRVPVYLHRQLARRRQNDRTRLGRPPPRIRAIGQ